MRPAWEWSNQLGLTLQVVRAGLLLLQAEEGAGPAVLGAARAALNGACAPAETPSDARAVAHALLGQVEAMRRKPERALLHIQQVCLAGASFPRAHAQVSALLFKRWQRQNTLGHRACMPCWSNMVFWQLMTDWCRP